MILGHGPGTVNIVTVTSVLSMAALHCCLYASATWALQTLSHTVASEASLRCCT